MDLRELIERDMKTKRIDEELKINIPKSMELVKKLSNVASQANNFKGLYEDGVKVMTYLAHLKAAAKIPAPPKTRDIKAHLIKTAAETIGVSPTSIKSGLEAYKVPDEMWVPGKEVE